MLYLVIIILVIFVVLVYVWANTKTATCLWYLSQVKVETWKYDNETGLWRKGEVCTLEEWLDSKNLNMMSVDCNLLEEYFKEVWIAWDDETKLPLPAALQDKERLEKMSAADLYGPWP